MTVAHMAFDHRATIAKVWHEEAHAIQHGELAGRGSSALVRRAEQATGIERGVAAT